MLIHLHRYRYSPYGTDGYLEISGKRVGYTVEHPLARLPPGEYPITLDHPILKKGNGPFKNLDGSVCVGQRHCSGCVIKSADTNRNIYDRIQKSLKRGTPVTLRIIGDR